MFFVAILAGNSPALGQEAELAALKNVIVRGESDTGAASLAALLKSASPVLEPAPTHKDDMCYWLYTSGSTGTFKGVVLSHRSKVLLYLAAAAEYGCFTHLDHHLAVAPLHHGIGCDRALCSIFLGGSCTIAPMFHPEHVLVKAQRRGNIFHHKHDFREAANSAAHRFLLIAKNCLQSTNCKRNPARSRMPPVRSPTELAEQFRGSGSE